MPTHSLDGGPALSVILPTDCQETIERALTSLRRQTIAHQIEVIVVAPSGSAPPAANELNSVFFNFRALVVDPMSPLGIPRATGIRAAAAPFVFVGETHSFLGPDAAAKLVARAKDGPWDAVVPGFENANPTNLFSWSGFIVSYSRWSAALPEGQIDEAPMYDTLYRREILIAAGDQLEQMLSFGDELRRMLETRGVRIYFEPAARLEHVNISQWWPLLNELFLIGLRIGVHRAPLWPWWRRLLYMLAAGLIPVVLLHRMWQGLLAVIRTQAVPFGTLPAALFILFARAAGEWLGYTGVVDRNPNEAIDRYEIRRFDYVN